MAGRGAAAKEAWRLYRKAHGTGGRSRSSNPTRARRFGRRARKAFGTIGWKGLLAGTASLALLRIAIRRLTGGMVPDAYVDSASLVGAGLAGKGIKQLGTAHLTMPGVVLGLSKLIEDVVTPNGLYTLPGIQGGGGWDA